MRINDAASQIAIRLGSQGEAERKPQLRSNPLLAAVGRAGTTHIYADSADADEIGELVTADAGAIWSEVDGSTANQPLVRKVIERYLKAGDPAAWARDLRAADASLSDGDLTALLYAVICARTATDVVRRFAVGRAWGASLQLHMSLGADAEAAKTVGRLLRRMVPSGVVKVPFMPHQPHCFLVARDLEREGIPVNFTSTFSARQTLAAALLSDVALTNIFMGRINQAFEAKLLGEHVDLAAQRALLAARRESGAKTMLIVASVREWQTFVQVAGCDVFTSPCKAIAELMSQKEIAAGDIRSQLETSYEDRLGIPPALAEKAGAAAIKRLYHVEPDLARFMTELRSSKEYQALTDGDRLVKLFDQAGFGDLFYAPSAGEWTEMRKNKLPDFDTELPKRLPLDTLFTLLADADFEKYQEEMDAMMAAALRA